MKNVWLFIILMSTPILNAQTRESDSLALVAIYYGLDGDNWINSDNWLTDTPIEDWHEVTVNNDRVTGLRIVINNASGDFPLDIYELTALEKLFVSKTAINGPIPDGISALTNLQEISFSDCGLTGELPSDMGQLEKLRRLSFPSNNLSGNLPEIGSQVNYINLISNQFTGPIPQSWASDELWQIRIANNMLTGNLDICAAMTGLDVLSLFNNNWDPQSMPEWLDDLPLLRSFQCRACNIEGEIPLYDFSNSSKLYQILLPENNITGGISNIIPSPTEGNQDIWLDLADNNLEGELPLHLFGKVGKLIVSNNDFSNLTTPGFTTVGNLNLESNRFTITDYLESIEQLFLDSVNIYYGNQMPIQDADTIIVTEANSITLEAMENYPGVEYQWTKSNQIIDGATESTYTLEVDESSSQNFYDCILTFPLFTESDGYKVKFYRGSTTVIADITSSVEDVTDRYGITFAPNPAIDRVQVQSKIDFQEAPYQILSLSGSVLQSGVISNSQSIDLTNVIDKLIILKIVIEDGVSISKVGKR